MRIRWAVLALVVLFTSPFSLLAQQAETATFTTGDESFSFEYPADWYLEVPNGDLPSSSVSISNLPLEERFEAPNDINLQITFPAKAFAMVGYSEGMTPRDYIAQSLPAASAMGTINFVTPSADGTPQPLQIEPGSPDIQEFAINRRSAAFAYAPIDGIGRTLGYMAIIADLGDDYWISIVGSSLQGGLETLQQNESTILALVQSMRYTPPPPVYSGNPDLPQVYSGGVGIWQRGSISFYYPQDWYVMAPMGLVMMTNQPTNVMNTQPSSGQFIASVQGISETRASADPEALFNQCSAQSHWTARELVEKILGNISPAQIQQFNNAGITIAQPEVITVDGVEIVYLRQYQGDFEVLGMFIDLGNGDIPSMSVTAHRGEMAQFEPQLFAVAATFQYEPKPCEQPDLLPVPTVQAG